MSTKTYILQADSRQFPLKKVGDTIELAPAAAKYLVQAGVLAEKTEEIAAPAKSSRKPAGTEG